MSSTFQKKLTGDIYAIISEFNDKAWLKNAFLLKESSM